MTVPSANGTRTNSASGSNQLCAPKIMGLNLRAPSSPADPNRRLFAHLEEYPFLQ
jgi:hypothetical protein